MKDNKERNQGGHKGKETPAKEKEKKSDHEGHGEQDVSSAHQGRDKEKEHAGHGNGEGHDDHAAHSPEMFRSRFWVSLLLTIPVLIYSHHIQMWLGFQPPPFPGSDYLPFLLSTVIFFYGGIVFLRGGRKELLERKPGMMTLISLAILVAYGYSLMVTLGFPGEELYWELATLVTIMLLGHWLEMNAVQGAQGALKEMAKLLPDTAVKIVEEKEEKVPLHQLKDGDLVLIHPGERVPADGKVVRGESQVNESMITGESMPASKGEGDEVIAGTINEGGSLRVKVEKTGEETVLAGIMRLVEQAQSSKSRAQGLADKAAFWLVVIALSVALLTALTWGYFQAGTTFIMERVVTVLVGACPHALGLAIPLVIAISTYLSAKNGLLVKDRLSLEEARNLDCIVFDKTGTLTKGEQGVVDIYPGEGVSEEKLLTLAAGVESDSEHMIARALVKSAQERGLSIPQASSFEAMAGRGVKGIVQGQEIYVGGPNLLEEINLSPGEYWRESRERAEKAGQSTIFVLTRDEILGMIVFADVVREESHEAVQALKKYGIQVFMLTGDSSAVAEKVSGELGIERYFAGVLPEHKASKIEQLKEEGYQVGMVGDGINDAPALAVAKVGIAIGAGTDVAVESAGIVLVRNDPRDVVRLIKLSRATYSKMLQNLGWAAGYNVVILPLAAGVLAPVGFIMPMALAAVVMSASTIIVALNAQLLRRINLDQL